jgi:hypothetical protein
MNWENKKIYWPKDYIWMAIYLTSQTGFILYPEDSGQ